MPSSRNIEHPNGHFFKKYITDVTQTKSYGMQV